GKYSTQEINELERRFLSQINYELYVSEETYNGFLSYLEVSMGLKQIWGKNTLSYKDVKILSQNLLPHYIDRLNITLQPIDMLVMLGKAVSSLCIMYMAALAFLAAATASALIVNSIMELSVIQYHTLQISPPHNVLNQVYGMNFSPTG